MFNYTPMKTKLVIILFAFLILFTGSSTAFATVKITPDKPADPDFVCKTEADIPTARAQAIIRGGGPDFANSAEVLCRSQIQANAPKTTNTTVNNYQNTYTAPATDYSIQACKMVLDGGQVIDGKCTCPADKIAKQLGQDKYQCVSIPTFTKLTPVGSNQPVATTSNALPIARATLSQTLKFGTSGPQVNILQVMLGVSQTGYFGPKTRQAVIDFQKLNNIPQTGVVGELTRKALNK